jgi:hypothetical protein
MKNQTPWLAVLMMVGMSLFAGSGIAADAPVKADDLKKMAAAIDGYRFQFPCKGEMPDKPKPGADCDSA